MNKSKTIKMLTVLLAASERKAEAAIADLSIARDCETCAHNLICEEKCMSCMEQLRLCEECGNDDGSNWQWRGVRVDKQ